MNRIRQMLSEHRVSFGAWSVLPGSLTAEIMGGAGFDWVIVDAQHGGQLAELVARARAQFGFP